MAFAALLAFRFARRTGLSCHYQLQIEATPFDLGNQGFGPGGSVPGSSSIVSYSRTNSRSSVSAGFFGLTAIGVQRAGSQSVPAH